VFLEHPGVLEFLEHLDQQKHHSILEDLEFPEVQGNLHLEFPEHLDRQKRHLILVFLEFLEIQENLHLEHLEFLENL
jgi:hypothetical protein